jgi:hypothetical protein
MSEPFFTEGALTNTGSIAALRERIEQANDNELKQLEDELSDKPSHWIGLFDERVITGAESNKAFLALINSLKIPNQLTSGSTEALMCRATDYAVSGVLTVSQFEQTIKKLIEGASFKEQAGGYGSNHTLNTAISRAQQKMAGAKFFKLNSFPVLDAALAKDIRNEWVRYGVDQRMFEARHIVKTVNLPESVTALLECSLNNPQSYHLQGFIKNLFNSNKLSVEYIQAAMKVVDVDVFCKSCRDEFHQSAPITSINNFVEVFGDEELFEKSLYKKMSGFAYGGIFPSHLRMLSDRNLKVEQLPKLTTFVMRNLDVLYPLIKPDEFGLRYRILQMCSSNGMAHEALELEVQRWKKMLSIGSRPVPGAALLKQMRSSSTSSNYSEALQTLLSIGLLNAEPVLSAVDSQTWRDLMEVHEPEADEKKALMKLYPSYRGALLEDELGL